ncbi:MAG: replication-associated recombination protein A [Ruminococcaceae bacterium]|nr:replication-associated recombination protein A [Oscillospiraceae bacterium]
MQHAQLADLLRPQSFDDLVGQEHLFGERGVIRRMLAGGRITNMIFFGPPGTGKTTAASIIAKQSGMEFRKLNATSASLADVKSIIGETSNLFGSNGILLYLDEIQYFNRKQQQSLLEYIEDGRITLIASTADNPYFFIYNAILSRCSVFEFKAVAPQACLPVLRRALRYLNEETGQQKEASDELLTYVGQLAHGDVRHSVVLFENAYHAAEDVIEREHVESFHITAGALSDDLHYDLLSCLQKSIRGSDPDAAVFYLAKLLSMGELLSVCRRLQVISSEDVGLAYPMATAVVRACCESARELGMPEAQIPLTHAALLLATAPKSNSSEAAILAAMEDVKQGKGIHIPEHLQSPLFKGYRYPHDYPNHYVDQRYLPTDLPLGTNYYTPGQNKTEQAAAEYWRGIKKK